MRKSSCFKMTVKGTLIFLLLVSLNGFSSFSLAAACEPVLQLQSHDLSITEYSPGTRGGIELEKLLSNGFRLAANGKDSSQVKEAPALFLSNSSSSIQLIGTAINIEESGTDQCTYDPGRQVFEYRVPDNELLEFELNQLIASSLMSNKALHITAAAIGENAESKADLLPVKHMLPSHTGASLAIPPIAHQFVRLDGSPTINISTSEILPEFEGEIEYFAYVEDGREDPPIAINDIPLLPGIPLSIGKVRFGDGHYMNLNVRADLGGLPGQGEIHLIPAAGEGGIIVNVPFEVWMPEVKLVKSIEDPYQLFDQISVTAYQNQESACALSGSIQQANLADPIEAPTCYLKWRKVPPEMHARPTYTPELAGAVPEPGQYGIEYEVILLSEIGTEFVLAEGKESISVQPVAGALSFGLDNRIDTVYYQISDVDLTLIQMDGPECSVVTSDVELAEEFSLTGKPSCLVTWIDYPKGLEASTLSRSPILHGRFEDPNEAPIIGWSISSVSSYGMPVELLKGESSIDVLTPTPATVRLSGQQEITPGVYVAPNKGGHFAELEVETLNQGAAIEVYTGGDLTFRHETPATYGDHESFTTELSLGPKPLWDSTEFKVKASYLNLPVEDSVHSFEVLSVPSTDLIPSLAAVDNLDRTSSYIQVSASIFDKGDPDQAYSPIRMGHWDIKLIDPDNQGRPFAPYQPLGPHGASTFSIGLDAIGDGHLELIPQARVHSPVEGFDHSVKAQHSYFFTSFQMNDARPAQLIEGKAPFHLIAAARLDHTPGVAKIIWQVKGEGADQWVNQKPQARHVIHSQFLSGRHAIRAVAVDENGETIMSSQEKQIVVHDTPEIEIKGPRSVFVGSSGTFEVGASEGSTNGFEAEDFLIEWSEDGGSSWNEGGPVRAITRTQVGEYQISVRLTSTRQIGQSQASDPLHKTVSFLPIKSPSVGIHGPKAIEVGQSTKWTGFAKAPYPDMGVTVESEFILPDGTLVDADTAEYIATKDDKASGQLPLSYRAWIRGYESQGASASADRLVNVWEYTWPAWKLNVQSSSFQAPSSVSVEVVNPMGTTPYLDGLSIDWSIPVEATVVEQSHRFERVLRFEAPGTYAVSLTLRDERGNETRLRSEVTIFKSDPWVVDLELEGLAETNIAPLSVAAYPVLRGGHPFDRLKKLRFYLNDEIVSDGSQVYRGELPEGDHLLKLWAQTEFGIIVEASARIEVMANRPPTCDVVSIQTNTGWRFSANCLDPDGWIDRHIWTVNGEPVSSNLDRISVVVLDGSQPSVTVSAVDNKGAVSKTVNP